MAAEIDLRLAQKGKREPRRGLVDQGKVSLGLAGKYTAELDDAGWEAEETAALAQAVALLDSEYAEKLEAEEQASEATTNEGAALLEAKALIRKLRNALPRVLRQNPVAGISAATFQSGVLGRSTSKVSDYLGQIQKPLQALDGPLQKYFKQKDNPQPKKPSELFAAAKQKLDEANVTQELELSGLPRETLEVYEAKGRALELIEDLNRAAKSAFEGQAELIGQFNKDILLRARKARAAPPSA
jgi:hypothetical protein